MIGNSYEAKNITIKIIYKKSLYKHHALINNYKSNNIIFGYLSYKIHMSVVYSNFFRWV